jgi:PAS domain S-box-containing protein
MSRLVDESVARDPRVLAEQVRMLYVRAPIAQATVVVNAFVVTWIFWDLVPPARSIAWVAALCAAAAVRMGLVRAYRRRADEPLDATLWARRFVAGALLTGFCWGAAALIFYAPQSPIHGLFLAFVLGGMTAGAASSNASHTPAFLAYAAPALLPMIVRLLMEADPIHGAMAFMLTLFGVAVAGISRSGGRAMEEALQLRFRNEALVEGLTSAQLRLESLNQELEQRVGERTAELEHALTALRQSEQRLRALADSMTPLAWTARPDGSITWFNRRWYEYTGTTFEQLAESGCHIVHDPATLPDVRRRWKEAITTGTTFEMEFPLRNADGKFRRFLTRAFPLKDSRDNVTQWFGTHTDVTELVEAHEALRESDRRKNQFIAVLSHELRNPLAPIRSSLYLLEHASQDSPQFARAREVIDRQTQHLTRLVDDLLDATRISQGKIELRRARIDAREVVRRACDDHRAAFHERDVELRVEELGPAWIDADETRIAQVVGNLLHNAVKFSRAGGTVVVRVGTAGDHAEIRVRDDGIGISADLLPRVFEPFVQAYDGLARTAGGLGLGLALVKSLVELHGGSVHARSAGVDRGAEFILTFPLAPAPERAPPSPVPVSAPRREPARVLVIEDNLDSARTIADVLALEGHQVQVATDAQSGIAMARELKPDVIVCDIGLPDMDGYELVRTLRADDQLRSTRFIALSGYAQPEDRQRAIEAGFDTHLSKPAAIDTLLALVGARD